ncbi:MAG: hypothetical protein JSV86_16100 [Gemmatimonadota bacterium]|nr:MAG: hypothetical protein JSV86_16100 [Gemmatimonadota bacterium]
MIIPIFGDAMDERFLVHRLRSTSLAGVVGGLLASGLFVYQYFANDAARWDLLAVAVTIALVKLAGLAYYRLVD